MAEKKTKENETPNTETPKKASPKKESPKKTKQPTKKAAPKREKEQEKKGNFFTDSIKFITGLFFKKMATGGAGELRSNAEEINQLNVFPVPDGDTGDNMSMTIDSGVAAIENIESDDIAEVSEALSRGMLLGARGNSGVILSQFFAGISSGLCEVEKADAKTFGKALQLGVEKAYASVMTPTEGTILTVMREAVEYATSRLNKNSTIKSLFNDLVKEMNASLERTPELLPALKDAGVVDSGAAGLLYIMDGFNRVLGGEQIEAPEIGSTKPVSSAAAVNFDADCDMAYAYCTEVLVQLTKRKGDPDKFDVDALKAFLKELGDSIVAIKSDTIVKVHVHTLTPDKVLGYMLKHGEFINVKIENMSLQHTELEAEGKAPDAKAEAAKTEAPKKKNAIVAVCMGDGIEGIYRDLGCDYIIRGGQTQNPSTNDFIEAFGTLHAENIFVFPNNGNILMAAEQARDLYTEANVIVLPSKNVGIGYAALAATDITAEPDEVKAAMEDAMARVTAGYVSPAIRDTQIEGVNIKDGDIMGIIGKEIVVAVDKQITAAVALADALLSKEGTFMLTAFVGEDVTEEEQAAVEEKINALHPDAEVYFTYGGQAIYPYIFVAE
ncbi:MAG: DAK2 domain-containing protein [Clostridia bacterium]|nr:DAK2 domain-containing protein [Clostridia bacterium]